MSLKILGSNRARLIHHPGDDSDSNDLYQNLIC
jgi:hypothetical protein